MNIFLHEAILFKDLDNTIQCLTCEHKCKLSNNKTGLCKTRKNIDNKLYTLVYGNISSISNNPIEKKPFFHFHPGTFALTVGTFSCNFKCDWCQNYSISKTLPVYDPKNYISPEDLVKLAINKNSDGLSYSFNEPTLLFEHSLQAFKIARSFNLYNTYVSNGYMTLDALKMLIDAGLDAINIDIKGNKETVKKHCGANLDYIFRNASYAKKNGVHVELTTLIIPGVNDNESMIREIAELIIKNLGSNTPWHLTRYFPNYKYTAPPTKIEILEQGMRIAKDIGIEYVYIGNVPGHEGENTYCHNCNKLLIKRSIFSILEINITNKHCPYCGIEIPIIK
ncbi:MAG: AmmeMemoRadiSam system radical SAM enzyme [Candidatus Helarchaeota archaeon]